MDSVVGYFPGCSLHATAREYAQSIEMVAARLGIRLAEIDDWACCGATSAHATNHLLSIALPARTLALAEAQGHTEVFAPCAACFNRLATAKHALDEDEALLSQVKGILARPFDNHVVVRNIAEVLTELIPVIKTRVTTPLTGLKVACYYGCLLVRPPAATGCLDAEAPTMMEDVVKAAGATPVIFNKRLDCCGAGLSLTNTGSVIRLSRAIVEDARSVGAEALIVACPMCHANLDLRQHAMKLDTPLPVLFLTELVGLALGLSSKELGLNRHFVAASGVAACAGHAAAPQGRL